MVLSFLDRVSGTSHRISTVMENSIIQDTEIVFVPGRVFWGWRAQGPCTLRCNAQRVCLHRDLSSPSFLPSSPVGPCPACVPQIRVRGGSLSRSAFLSEEPLVSSCNESQPQLSSCQTGFFKNISVFTQHELISLQCPWGLIAGGRGCALGTPPHPVLKCQYRLREQWP